jgi:hypothetical protein
MSKYAVMPLSDYVRACDKIREKAEITERINSAELPSKVDEVYEAGKKSQYNEDWNNQLDGGKRTNFNLAFSGIGWNDKTFKPPIKIKPTDSYAYMMFARTGVTSITFEMLDVSDVTVLHYSFYLSNYLRSVEIDIRSCKKLSNTFQTAYALEYLHIKNISPDCVFIQTFDDANILKELIIEGVIGQNGLNFQWSTKLSKASIISIINALSTTTSGLSITLSKTAVETAFGSTTSA